MKLILTCKASAQPQLYVFKEQYHNGNKYFSQIGELVLEKVDSFTKLVRALRLEEVDLAKYSIVDGEDMYVKAFKIAQAGELSYYNAKERIVDICQRLLKGEHISTERDAITYGVHPETIKLDIYTLRNILTDYTIDFDGKYKLNHAKNLSVAEAFVLLLMVYHSKSLNGEEVKRIQDKVVKQFSGMEQQTLIRFFQSYTYYYKPYIQKSQLQLIENVFRAVSEQQYVSFLYRKKTGEVKQKTVKPLTVILHDRMYYLVGEDMAADNEQPINYRFDRIFTLEICDEKFKTEENNRFQQGQYIEEAFNMYTGKKEVIRFKAKASITEYVLRQFPHAICIKEDTDSKTYDVIVRGTEGILLWLLSQKANIEVLSPQHMRDKMKQVIMDMLQLYELS